MRNQNDRMRLMLSHGAFDSHRCLMAWGTDVTAIANYIGRAAVIYPPEVIEIMSAALEASINSLPEPVSATHVHYLAESILHSAGRGERDVAVLERIALVELRMTSRD
jgi:hypothetical protein